MERSGINPSPATSLNKNTQFFGCFYLIGSGIIGLKQATKLLGSKFVYENERQRSSNKYKFAHSRHKCAERAKSISLMLGLNHRSKVVHHKRKPDGSMAVNQRLMSAVAAKILFSRVFC